MPQDSKVNGSTESQQVAEGLRLVRERLGITQQALAERSGVDRATISQIENGHKSPRMNTISRLAESLGVDITEIFQSSILSANSSNRYVSDNIKSLHPGLQDLLEDENMRLMLALTADEEIMLRSIRTKSSAPLTKQFFIDVLIAYRKHHEV